MRDVFVHSDGLVGLYSSGKNRPHQYVQHFLQQEDPHVLIVDPNRRWSSEQLTSKARIIRPPTKSDIVPTLHSLEDYISPRLHFVYIDDLPLYFREYYGRDRLYTQNIRFFTLSLSILRKLSTNIRVIFSTYENVVSTDEPIYFDQTKYYTKQIFTIRGPIEAPEIIKLRSIGNIK
jgi:hypothetical protein